jgi:phosphoribosyl 1,2-cyclic phosphodiesterase
VRVTIWGCRGSVPTPGPQTVRYGGNTSCVEVVVDDDSVLVLDAGTGIRGLGLELHRRGTRLIRLLLTHLHLDHLEGLRFFAPLYDDEVTLEIWGPPSPTQNLRDRVARSFSPPLFPLELRDVPARVSFHDVPREDWQLDGVTLRADLVVHPGATVGFRLETATASLGYIPDHEPALVGDIEGKPLDWLSGSGVGGKVDLLLHDAQYSEQEYAERIGWGHSSIAHAVSFARAVEARRLLLFHHEPYHGDDALDRLEESARSLDEDDSLAPTLAREGMVIELP